MIKKWTEDYLEQYYWVKDGDTMPWRNNEVYAGSMSVANGALAADGSDDATVEAIAAANIVLIKPRNGTVSLEFRFRSDGTVEGDQEVLNLYAAAGVDFYQYADTLTIDRGLCEYSSTIFFYDKIVSTGEKWPTATNESGDTDEKIGWYVMNTHGYDRFAFVMTTKDANTTNLYIDWRRH